MIDGIGTTMKFSRSADGNVIINITDAKKAEIKNVGTVSGNAQLQFGVTGEDDFTQYLFKHEGDSDNNISLSNTDGNHYNIVGNNINISSQGGNAERTIQVDAKDSKIDLGNAGGSQFVYMSNESKDNKVTLGNGSDNYIDAGKFNNVKAEGGTNRFESTYESHGSVMVGGAGNDTFLIAGKYGVIDGGDGSNTFEAVGMFGENQESSYRNVFMGGSGDDTLIDKGGYNIFFGGDGNNSYESHGTGGIAQIGANGGNASGIFGSSAIKTYIFSGEEITSTTGTTYKISDIMKQFNWSLNDFLYVYSQISEEDPDSLGNHDVVDAETMKKLEAYFANNL